MTVFIRLPRTHKYRAKPIEIDEHKFPSTEEGKRYCELKLLVKIGDIWDLELQPAFPLVVNGTKICTYKADFRYKTKEGGTRVVSIVEDVKGVLTPLYRLKKKLFQVLYKGVIFREVYVR